MKVCIDTFIDAVGEVHGKSGRLYRFEFHEMFGPTLINQNGEVSKRNDQLYRVGSERHEFWKPFHEWLDNWKRGRK